MRYAVVIEKGERNYSAYIPDLRGCVSVGDTPEEVTAEIRGAIEFHLEGMREDQCRSRSHPLGGIWDVEGERLIPKRKPSWPGLSRPSTR